MNKQIIITLDIDEEKIIKEVERAASKEVAKWVIKNAFEDDVRDSRVCVRQYVENCITGAFNQDRERIINKTIDELVSSVRRQRWFKNKIMEKFGEAT